MSESYGQRVTPPEPSVPVEPGPDRRDDGPMIRRQATVTGRVQGVGYRFGVREQAARLRVTATAHNRPDGSVHVEMEGEPEAVEQLADWLWQGPPAARVEDVVLRETDT